MADIDVITPLNDEWRRDTIDVIYEAKNRTERHRMIKKLEGTQAEYFKTGKLRKITRTDFDQARTEIKSIVKPWMRKAQITVAKLRLEEHFSDLMDQASGVTI